VVALDVGVEHLVVDERQRLRLDEDGGACHLDDLVLGLGTFAQRDLSAPAVPDPASVIRIPEPSGISEAASRSRIASLAAGEIASMVASPFVVCLCFEPSRACD